MQKKFIRILCVLAITTLGTTSLMAETTAENSNKESSKEAVETKEELDEEKTNEDIPDVENLLTMESAIERAISNDSTLVKYNRDLEVYQEEIKQMDDYGSQKYLSKVIDIEEVEQKIEFQKDKVAKNIADQYQTIILLEKQLELLDKQIALSENRVKQAELQKDKGYIDGVTYDKTITSLENAKITKEQSERNLADIKNSFNKLTFCKVDEHTLYAPAQYTPFELETTINAYAQGKAFLMTDFTTQRIELAEEKFWDNFAHGPAPTYDIYLKGKTEIKNNKDMVESQYDNYVLMIENQYTNLERQMDTINTKKKDIETILKDEKILDIRYKNGYISKMDYDTQKMQLLSTEVEYISEVYRYNILKMQIEKPWV